MAYSYDYVFYYGNGDYYWGTGYTDASTALVYQQNPYLYTSPDETGSTGYYDISNVSNLGDGVGTEGSVQVNGYYDAASNRSVTSLSDYTGTLGYGAGYSGLGSELGYAYNADFSNADTLFGQAYYEAGLESDLAGIPAGRVTADNPSSPGPGAPVNLAPDPNEWNVSYDGDGGPWETATKSLNANNELVIQFNDNPSFDNDESYTLDLVNSSGLGFTQETYIVNEDDGSATIALSSSGPFTTAKFIIQDDDWNNDFANAISLNEIAAVFGDDNFISDDSTNVGATKETGELNHAGNTGGASIWWSWTAPSSGIVQINADSILDTTLGVYTGSSISDLTEVASNDNDPSASENGDRDSLVLFEAVADTTYYIAVDGYNGATGDVGLDLEVISALLSL